MNDPTRIPAVQWLLVGIQVATLVAVLIYVAKTSSMASATAQSAHASAAAAEEMRLARLAAHAPRLALYFHTVDTHLAYVVIENLGETAAQDVMVVFDPPLQSSLGPDSVAFFDTPKVLAARSRLPHGFDVWHQYFAKNLPTRYDATVCYVRADTGARVQETHVLDAGGFKNLHSFTRKSIHHLAEALEKHNDLVKNHTKLIATHFEHEVAERELTRTNASLREDVFVLKCLWAHFIQAPESPRVRMDSEAVRRVMRRHAVSAMATADIEGREALRSALANIHLALLDARFRYFGDTTDLEQKIEQAIAATAQALETT